jgi:2,5-diketo-D-gluconate reductase B
MNLYFTHGHERAFGTWPLKGSELTSALETALDIGYRAIDTAQLYGNEAEVGAVLRASGLARQALCVTTKVAPDHLGEDRFLPSVEASLRALNLDQVDVLLIHWPPADGDVVPPLRRLEQAARRGLARHVGVSNFTAAMMRTARATLEVPLVVNQVEFHPLLDQRKLLAAAVETGIPLSAYCSVARGEVFKYPVLEEIGRGYGKSAAQITLRWILQKGVPVTTMSSRRVNIQANFDVMDFTLSSIDMARIDALNAVGHRVVNKSRVPWAPDFD